MPLLKTRALIAPIVIASAALAQESETASSTDEVFAGQAAWQSDAGLGEKWKDITGRFIFQRTCLPCHRQGPASFSKRVWRETLDGFPDVGHAALLPEEFEDLTAMFSYGEMVPDDAARYQSLGTFLLNHAPEKTVTVPDEPLHAVDLLPKVGQVAPEFSIVDVEGTERSIQSYVRDRRALILVFSRAHW